MTPESTIKSTDDTICSMVDRIYSIDQVAEILSIKPRTVRQWITDGKIKSFKLGGLIRVHDDDLQAFIDLSRKGSEKK